MGNGIKETGYVGNGRVYSMGGIQVEGK
ncbi:hypothetical protein CDAR_220271, partial [Caerostris darwini]